MEIIVKNLEQMKEFALKITKKLYPGCVITLSGDLGAGKTTLSKMIAKEIGVLEDVTSPTYNIMKIYESGSINLYHFDLYRLDENSFDYDLEDYMYLEGLSLVEWPDKFKDILPKERLEIYIEIKNENERVIKIHDEKGTYGDLNDLNN